MSFVFGGDVSHWQMAADFAKANANGWRFVYLKATQATWTDDKYIAFRAGAKAAGLDRGAYHFLTWTTDPAKQAEHFWNTIKDDPGELPPCVDFEWWGSGGTPANAFDILYRFVERLKQLYSGRIVIYTAASFWKEAGNKQDAYWKQYLLWLAHYDDTPPANMPPFDNWFIWQTTGNGDGHKYGMASAGVDLDYANEEMYNALTGQEGETSMWTDKAIGLYCNKAGWTNQAFNFIVGYAGGNWTQQSPGVLVLEPNPNLKPIELQARAEGKTLLMLWDFDVDFYRRAQFDASEERWPPEDNDYPFKALKAALVNRDFDGLIIRVMNRKNLDGGNEMMRYVAFAARKFVERANRWLYTTKGMNRWTFVLSNDDFMNTDGQQDFWHAWTKDWYLGIEQEALRPLASGAWPQDADKIRAVPPSLGWKIWYHFNTASLDMMLWNGTDTEMRDFLQVGGGTTPPPPPPPTGDYVTRDEFEATKAATNAHLTALDVAVAKIKAGLQAAAE